MMLGFLWKQQYTHSCCTLSSSLMVSNTFDVRRLMTLIICGGATSVTNLAIREFAIFFGELDVGGWWLRMLKFGALIGLAESLRVNASFLGDIYEDLVRLGIEWKWGYLKSIFWLLVVPPNSTTIAIYCNSQIADLFPRPF